MKKFISAIILITMILSMMPCIIQAEEETTIPLSELQEEIVDFKSIEEQDVEVYVTDGYDPIPNAEVQLNNEIKTTDAEGKVLFEAIPAQQECYDVLTYTDIWGEKTTQLKVANKVKENTDAKIEFTVSYIDLNLEDQLPMLTEDDAVSLFSLSNTVGTLGEWVVGAKLPEERWLHQTVEYQGKLYLSHSYPVNHYLIYDINNNSWSTSSSESYMATGMGNIVLYNGKIYDVGEGGRISIYDIATDKWAMGSSANLSYVKDVAVIGNKIYAFETSVSQSAAVYDIEKNTWTRLTNIPKKYDDMDVVAAPNNKIYLMGGYTISGSDVIPSRSVYIYDTVSSKWSNGASMQSGRSGFKPIVYNGKIYVAGAILNKEEGPLLEIYDIANNKWTTGAEDEALGGNYSAILIGDNIYYMGGMHQTDFAGVKDVRLYNITNNTWTDITPMRFHRSGASAIFYNGKIYVTGCNIGNINTVDIANKGLEIYTVQDLPDIEYDRDIIDITNPGKITVAYGTPAEDLSLPEKITVKLDDNTTTDIPVTWNTSNYQSTNISEQTITGDLELPDRIKNTKPYIPEIKVQVNKLIYNVVSAECDDIEVKYGTLLSNIEFPDAVEAVVENSADATDRTTKMVTVKDWTPVSGYDSGLSGIEQEFEATIELDDGLENPNGVKAKINVIVKNLEGNIVSIEPKQISTNQTIPFNQISGVPAKVTALLSSGQEVELDVKWDTSKYDPSKASITERQIIEGDVTLVEGVTNTDNIRASLLILVRPTNYTVLSVDPTEETIQVFQGKTKEEILEDYKDKTVAVRLRNIETGAEITVDMPIDFTTRFNNFDENAMGSTQQLIADIAVTSNINIGTEHFFTLNVEMQEPKQITRTKAKAITTYQSVPVEEIENIPAQVEVILDNDESNPLAVDVEWIWDDYDCDVAGSRIIQGRLKNLPGYIVNPEVYMGTLFVTTKAVQYEITQIVTDYQIFDEGEVPAGLELDEVYPYLDTKAYTVVMQSVTEGVDITLNKDLKFLLKEDEELGYVYDKNVAETYLLGVELKLPEHITISSAVAEDVENNGGLLIGFTTNMVSIELVETTNMTVGAGTAYADLDLPETVQVKLSNGKTIAIKVDWMGENDYTPGEEYHIVMGKLVDIPSYINANGKEDAELLIRELPRKQYTLKSITPIRIPTTGMMNVKIGTSLDDIYSAIESHNVTLTLEDENGEPIERMVTFTLDTDKNAEYTPMTPGEYVLKGTLHIDNDIEVLNPLSLELSVYVQTLIYKVSGSVTSTQEFVKGTPFAELELPAEATAKFENAANEPLPAIWTESGYKPNATHILKGEFSPLPDYAENPKNIKPSLMMKAVASPTTKILSAEQITSPIQMFRMNNIFDEEIEGYKAYQYIVEYENEDGSIDTEIETLYAPVE